MLALRTSFVRLPLPLLLPLLLQYLVVGWLGGCFTLVARWVVGRLGGVGTPESGRGIKNTHIFSPPISVVSCLSVDVNAAVSVAATAAVSVSVAAAAAASASVDCDCDG